MKLKLAFLSTFITIFLFGCMTNKNNNEPKPVEFTYSSEAQKSLKSFEAQNTKLKNLLNQSSSTIKPMSFQDIKAKVSSIFKDNVKFDDSTNSIEYFKSTLVKNGKTEMNSDSLKLISDKLLKEDIGFNLIKEESLVTTKTYYEEGAEQEKDSSGNDKVIHKYYSVTFMYGRTFLGEPILNCNSMVQVNIESNAIDSFNVRNWISINEPVSISKIDQLNEANVTSKIESNLREFLKKINSSSSSSDDKKVIPKRLTSSAIEMSDIQVDQIITGWIIDTKGVLNRAIGLAYSFKNNRNEIQNGVITTTLN